MKPNSEFMQLRRLRRWYAGSYLVVAATAVAALFVAYDKRWLLLAVMIACTVVNIWSVLKLGWVLRRAEVDYLNATKRWFAAKHGTVA